MNVTFHIFFNTIEVLLFSIFVQVFEGGNREGMIKLEPPASSRIGDLTHLLSLIPSTSQSVLSETLSGVEQDSLLIAAQHIRTEEDIQRLLTGQVHWTFD
jgi:hypothetical protein